MDCRLCLKDEAECGGLQNSHTIPDFILKHAKENGRSIVFDRVEKETREEQFDWKERMLCKCCECYLNDNFEKYLKEKLYGRVDVKIVRGSKVTMCNVDNDRLAMAFLSILWRASVSKLPAFHSVALPRVAEDALRMAILNGKIWGGGWSKAFSIEIVRIIDLEDKMRPGMVSYPECVLSSRWVEYKWLLAFYYVSMKRIVDGGSAGLGQYRLKGGGDVLRFKRKKWFELEMVRRKVLDMFGCDVNHEKVKGKHPNQRW